MHVQDPLGKGAVRVDGGAEGPGALLLTDAELAAASKSQVYTPMRVAECGGEPAQQKWVFDKPSKGQISNGDGKLCLNVAGCETEIIVDGCEKPVKPCGTVTPAHPFPNEDFTLGANGNLVSAIGSLCATVGASKTVTLKQCVSPAAANQKWKYETASQQLTTGDGLCVTASAGPGPSPVKAGAMVLGRPLSKDGFAVLFMNNNNASMPMTCDKACMAKVGVPQQQAGTSYTVEDVITHEKVMTVAAGAVLTTKVSVPGNGGSIYYRLMPVV